MNLTAKRNDFLFKKALEMSGIDREDVEDHGYVEHFTMLNGKVTDFKQMGYLLCIKNGNKGGWVPIVFFFDYEEEKSE